MFQEAVDFVLRGLNGAVDVLTDLNTVAPIIGISIVGYLVLTVVSRLILPIIGGTLPSGMAKGADSVVDSIKEERNYKDKRAKAYAHAQYLRTYDKNYKNRTDN